MLIFFIGKTKYKVVNVSYGEFEFDIQGHAHGKNSYELHYVYAGKGTLETKLKSYSLKKDSFFVTGPNSWHKQIIDKTNPLAEYCIYLEAEGGENIISNLFLSTHFWFGKGNSRIRMLFKDIVELDIKNNLFDNERERLSIQLIVNELASIYSPDIVEVTSSTPDDKKFLIIEDAFLFESKSIRLEELSDRLKVSKRQTQRLLQKYYNKTFSQKKTEARMEMAIMLLKEGKSINEISGSLGYVDSPAFVRAFKSCFSKTPVEYKKNM